MWNGPPISAASVDFHRVAFNDAQLAGKGFGKFLKSGNTAPVAFDGGYFCTGTQQRAGQPAGAGANLKDIQSVKRTRHRCNPVKQLLVEQEILTKCLACRQAVPRDDFAQGR